MIGITPSKASKRLIKYFKNKEWKIIYWISKKDKIKRNNKASMLDAIMYFNKRKIKVNR